MSAWSPYSRLRNTFSEPFTPMQRHPTRIRWNNGSITEVMTGSDWLAVARQAGIHIPTGCLEGRCGACDIEVNGRVVRACRASVPACPEGLLQVELTSDPHW